MTLPAAFWRVLSGSRPTKTRISHRLDPSFFDGDSSRNVPAIPYPHSRDIVGMFRNNSRCDGEPAYRRGSVQPLAGPVWPSIYAAYLGTAPPKRGRTGRPCPTLGLAPGGVYQADLVARVAGALLPHRFTLACAGLSPPSAVCSLWHFPAGHPDWPLASTLPCGAPTFLDPVPVPEGPTRAAATRPAHRHPQCASRGRHRRPGAAPTLLRDHDSGWLWCAP